MKRNESTSLLFVLLFVLLFAVAGVVAWQVYLSSHGQGAVYDAVADVVQPQQVTALLTGIVTSGPTTPVCREGVSCTVPVASHVVQVLDDSGAVAATTKTDENGRYAVQLKPGAYMIVLSPRVGVGARQNKYVTVHKGTNSLDITVDTGIR